MNPERCGRTMMDFKRFRQTIAAQASSNDAAALAVITFDLTIYGAALFGFCVSSGVLRWVELGVASIMAGALFLAGHDAAHRALAKTRWLNAWIAHIAFMPSLTPQAGWIIGHNQRHHGFTNLRGVDYVWTPWSPQEFSRATVARRTLYRFYRTALGIGFYYFLELWLVHLWREDDRLERTDDEHRQIVTDRAIALAGLGTIFALCFGVCVTHAQGWSIAAWTAAAAVVVPFIVYQYLMSVVIYIHHTHPSVRWFASKETYDPLVAQMQSTVHVRFPKPIEWLFHEIFQHTAHHLNPRIPLYRLARAQRTLEQAPGAAIIQETFSLRYVRMLMRECQLYDFETNCWLRIEDAFCEARPAQRASNASQTPRGRAGGDVVPFFE